MVSYTHICISWIVWGGIEIVFLFLQINMKGLDGIQGPVYVGTGCVFRRQALYGYDPPKGPKRPKMVSCDCCPCFGRRKKLQKYAKHGENGEGEEPYIVFRRVYLTK